VEVEDKKWYVVTLFGKYETIIKDRTQWEKMGYTYHEKDDEIILKSGKR
jgi:hypothetical protein